MPQHKTVTKLTNEETWKLGQWLSDLELSVADSSVNLASTASEMCGRKITENNIEGILKMIGKKIPRATDPVPQDEVIRLLANCIRSIATQLGMTMPSKLEDLL